MTIPGASRVIIIVLPLDSSSSPSLPQAGYVILLPHLHIVQPDFRQFLVTGVIVLELLLVDPVEEQEVGSLTGVLVRPPHKLVPVLVLHHCTVVENPPVVFRRPVASKMLVGNI